MHVEATLSDLLDREAATRCRKEQTCLQLRRFSKTMDIKLQDRPVDSK